MAEVLLHRPPGRPFGVTLDRKNNKVVNEVIACLKELGIAVTAPDVARCQGRNIQH
jgi:hypothetical protein